MIRRLLMTALIALFLVSAGCWDYLDLERHTTILGLSIDLDRERGGEGYVVTAELPRPTQLTQTGGAQRGGGQQQQEPRIFLSASGDSVAVAINRLDVKTSRRAIWEHIISVVISDEVAREGVAEVAELFLRNKAFNARARMFVSLDTAEDVLSGQPEFQPFQAVYLRELAEQFNISPRFARSLDVHTFNHLLQEGTVLLPLVRSTGSRFELDGGVAIRGGRVVAHLDSEVIEGVYWLLGEINRLTTDLPCPGAPGENFTVELRQTGRKIDVELVEDVPIFNVWIRADARLTNLARCRFDVDDRIQRRHFENQMARWIENRATQAIEEGQAAGVDFLRFGVALQQTLPQYWRRISWSEIFPKARASVHVRVSLRSMGELKRSVPYR